MEELSRQTVTPQHMTGEQILAGILETDFALHNVLRMLVNTEQVPSAYSVPLSKIFKKYLVNAEEAKDHSKSVDKRLGNLMQRGSEVCDVILEMVKNEHLSEEQAGEINRVAMRRAKFAMAYEERRREGVIIFDGGGKRAN